MTFKGGAYFYRIDLKFTCNHDDWFRFVDEYNTSVRERMRSGEYYPLEINFNREAFARTNEKVMKHLFFIDTHWNWNRLQNCISSLKSWRMFDFNIGFYEGAIYDEYPFLYRDGFSSTGWVRETWTGQYFPREYYIP
ncbi:MAG: hypothetical protein LBR15_04100 [Methanobrevibacter sp.]|jgi:hypothetical protein|nr:hypothetical protein [Candidatus Methanovirga australis]